MHEIILKTFTEWTKGLDSKESRIKIFENIRDIPFVVTWITDSERGPVELLLRNKGTCSPKHFLLGMMYQRLGIPVKYGSYPFRWGDLKVDYPENLKNLAEKLPVVPHLALKAYINNTWVLLDATWDPPLKKVGFPVNETWDGFSDTQNAVPALQEIIHESIEEREEFVDSEESAESDSDTEAQYELIEEFCNGLNRWFDEVRGG